MHDGPPVSTPLRATKHTIALLWHAMDTLHSRRSSHFSGEPHDPMDYYLTTMVLGGVGLAAMAFGGGSSHSHGAHGAHGAHGGGHSGGGQVHGGSHGASQAASHGVSHGAHQGAHANTGGGVGAAVASLMSPRVLFTVCLGIGATGLAVRPVLGGLPLFLAALAGGIVLERLIVAPIWALAFRFESRPALTLESSVDGEATVVSTFDANGQGLIAIEVDGQVMQVLGTLRADDRAIAGRIAVGTRVRIEAVDAGRNRCTVALL